MAIQVKNVILIPAKHCKT